MIKKKINYEFLAGGLAFGLLFLCFLLSGVVSLAGDKCILISDLYGQYYEFLIGIRRIVLEQRSLVFSWNLDMGIGIIGWIAYYVSSPFNLLLLIVPERFLLVAIVLMLLLKTASCAVTFTYACRKIFQNVGIHTVLMALGYSLSSYMVTYFLHIMWLDVVILLPLLVYYLIRMMDTGRWGGFTFCLAASFFTNYYISYMAGAFLFTCFLAYYIYRNGTILSFGFIKKFGQLIGCACLAFGMCAFLLIPTVYQMSERLGEGKIIAGKGIINVTLADLFQSMIIGNYTSLKYGKPLLYTSCFALLLMSLYFLNMSISKKEKYCVGTLLGLWILIMECPLTDLLMHMGNNPTWFPYRYSFVIVYMICMIGVRIFPVIMNHIEIEKVLVVSICLTVSCVTLLLLKLLGVMEGDKVLGMILTVFFIVTYSALFYLHNKEKIKQHDMRVLMCLCLCLELLANGVLTYRNMDDDIGFENLNVLKEKQDMLQSQLAELPDDNRSYRIEKNYRVGYNDGFAFGYNSLSSFTSVYNIELHKFFENAGILNQIWNSSYEGSTMFLDSILGIKYVLHSVPYSLFNLSTDDSEYIAVNEFCLPLGFMVSDDIEHFQLKDSESYSPFAMQQDLLEAMTGDSESRKCFGEYKPEKIVYDNVERLVMNGKSVLKRIDPTKEGKVSYQFKRTEKEKEYYLYPKFDYRKDKGRFVEIETEGKKGVDSPFVERTNMAVPYNIRIFANPNSTKDVVSYRFLENDEVILEQEIYYSFDKEMYSKYYDKLKQQGLTISKFDDGLLEGNVHVSADSELLFLSIPYNRQWKIEVDGKQSDVLPLCSGAFMGVRLDKGIHNISIRYQPHFLRLSLVFSVIVTSCSAFLLLTFHIRRKTNSLIYKKIKLGLM